MDTGVACYCYGDSTCGQRVFYQFGMTQIPIYNVNNNCSTGSTGLHLGRTMISGGMADAVLVVGFEKMFPGSLQSFFNDRANPTGTTAEVMKETRGVTNAPGAAQLFGNAGREYMEKYGAKLEDFAEIGRINHAHSKNNPYSQFQDQYSLEQIMKSTIELVGYSMSKHAAKVALEEANVKPKDVKVVELHDCFSANEMVTIDALGVSDPGKAHELVRAGGITYGGQCVINPSGGLISKGHPLGATGLAQCAELQHNLGLGGAVVCTVYKRPDGSVAPVLSDAEVGKINGLGYNPATQAKGFTKAQADSVRSKKARSDWALQDTETKVESRF